MLIESEALGDLTKEEEILLEPKVGQGGGGPELSLHAMEGSTSPEPSN